MMMVMVRVVVVVVAMVRVEELNVNLFISSLESFIKTSQETLVVTSLE